MSFGDDLRKRRLELGLSAKKLADMAGVRPITIFRMEAEKNLTIRKNLNRVAAPLGCRVRLVLEPLDEGEGHDDPPQCET